MLPSNPGVPQNGTGVSVTPTQSTAMQAKKLSMYVEFPAVNECGKALAGHSSVFETNTSIVYYMS
jgi:hypothetical protein